MAKSRSIGGIYASLTLRDGGFQKGLANASKKLGEFAKASALFAAGGVATASTALAAGTLKTLDMVDALGDVSAQTGIAISDMMKLQRAYADGGRAAEDVGKDVGKMQKAIVTAASGGDDPFEALGLSAATLLEMNPADQFNAIGESIMRLANPAERTAKAMQIFGKGGMGLTTVFEGLPDAAIALGKMPDIAQEFASRMGEANDLIGHLPIKADQFFVGFTAGIVDSIIPGLNRVNEFDFTLLGKSLGDKLTDAVKEFAIILNTTIDVFTGQDSKGAGGGNKYAEAQKDLDLEDKYARFLKDVEDAKKEKEKVRLDLSPHEESSKAPWFFKPDEMQVNDYQRKGWSLSQSPVAMTEDKQTALLSDVRDLLKKIAATREPLAF